MSLQERIARYLERNFREDQAHILVLMEEAAIALFSALPEHFVLIGGATLVLFHNSPRLSKDLDLLARDEALPRAEELEEALRARLGEVAGILGIGPRGVRTGKCERKVSSVMDCETREAETLHR